MTCGPYNSSPGPRGADDLRCPKLWQVIKLDECVGGQITVTVPDLALETLGDGADGPPAELTEQVRLIWKDHYGSSTVRVAAGRRVAVGSSMFTFDITPGHTSAPGLFVGEIVIYDEFRPAEFDDAGEHAGVPNPTSVNVPEGYTAVWRHRVFVEVAASIESTSCAPLTIAEIRLFLRDECADGNFLIDDLEYTDKEIFAYMRKIVDIWNETTPNVAIYTPSSFPFRAHWARGTIGLLLKSASRHKLRNWLPYTAGGVSVNDQSIWLHYNQLGEELYNEFRVWMMNKKIEINISGAYGSVRGRTTGWR